MMEEPVKFNSSPHGRSQPRKKSESNTWRDREHALHAEAWGGNRGIMTARKLVQAIEKKRNEAA